MRMMSWSRYHCLSWSFMRIRASLRRGGLARAHQKVIAAAVSTPAAVEAAPGTRQTRPRAAESGRGRRPMPGESDPQP